jgi:hypothetical protein
LSSCSKGTASPSRVVKRIGGTARRLGTAMLPAISTLVFVGCSSPPPPPPFTPIADNTLLMQSVVDPAADVIWESVGTIITKEGVEEIRPKNADEWTAVRNSAIALAESGNLLMMIPRAKDGGEWMTMSKALVDTGNAAIRAADARNPEQLFNAGGDIYVACTNCHQKYVDAVATAGK